MNQSITNRRLVLAFAPNFPIQSAFDVPFSPAVITARHPQNEPQFPTTLKTKDETRDCSGEYLLIRKVTSRISQFVFSFDATAKTAAGWLATAFGIAGNPTGAPQNEVQNIKTTNTAGAPSFLLDFEGLSGAPAAIPFNATAAQARSILERLRAIKPGNIVVTGVALNDAAGLNVEFINKLAKANLPLLQAAENTGTGGATTVSLVANGANRTHLITRQSNEILNKFSLISGFEGVTGGTKLYKNLVIGTVLIRAVKRGKVTITVTAFGSANYEVLTGYAMPACQNVPPIMVADCRARVAGDWITDDLQEFSYTFSTGIDPNDPDNFPFDDVDISELERGDRTSIFTVTARGIDTTPVFQAMENPDGYKSDIALFIGQPGERIAVEAASAQLELDDQPLTFIGTKNKSAFNVTATPTPDDTTGTVDQITYTGANATQYLLTAV